MYNKVLRRIKAIFSRCLKPFKKQESHEVKEYWNCCCRLQRRTLLTGFSKSDKSKKCRRMTIKPFVFLLCASGFSYQTWAFLQMYLAYPTTLDISEEYPDSFMAPAITICNINRLLRQPYCKAYPEHCTWKHTTWEAFCDEYSRMCPEIKPTNFSFGIPLFRAPNVPNRSLNYLDALYPQTEYDTVYACRRYGDNGMEPCAADAHNIVIPRQGQPHRCFRYLLKKEGLYEEQSNLTLTDGFAIGLNMYPEEYFNTIDPVEASIVLHDPRKIVNPMTDGITLSAGNIYKVFATMERRESLPPPYASKCVDYLTEWKKNGGFGPLSKDDCIKDCTISAMVDRNGCVGQTMTYPSRNEICHATYLGATSEMITKCASGCRDACEEYNYHFTSDVTLDMQTMCNLTDEYCKVEIPWCVWKRISSTSTVADVSVMTMHNVQSNNTMGDLHLISSGAAALKFYLNEEVTLGFLDIAIKKVFKMINTMCTGRDFVSRRLFIVLSFNRMKVKIFKQIPRIESIELFSYIGGYLGMWLGISLASAFDLAELIYEVIGYAFLKRKENQNKTTPIQQFRNQTVIV